MVISALQRGKDRVADRISIPVDGCIPKPQDTPTEAHQLAIASPIRVALGMLTAIELNGQHRLNAGEIQHVRWHRMLPTEPMTFQVPAAKPLP